MKTHSKQCAGCPAVIKVKFRSQLLQRKFCSRQCSSSAQKVELVNVICRQCENMFGVIPARVVRARFCSRQCVGAFTIKDRKQTWEYMKGNSFRKGWSAPNKGENGQRGALNHSWVDPVLCICAFCQNSFSLKPWEKNSRTRARKLLKTSTEQKLYCRRDCYLRDKMGLRQDKDPTYRGGHVKYYGADWKKQRHAALARDRETCQDCGKFVGAGISVHHIKQFHLFKKSKNANKLYNLVCLCRSCHMSRHAQDHIKARARGARLKMKRRKRPSAHSRMAKMSHL